MWSLVAIRADLDLETRLLGRSDDSEFELFFRQRRRKSEADEFHALVYFFRGTLRSLYSAERQLGKLCQDGRNGDFWPLAERAGKLDAFRQLLGRVRRHVEAFTRYRNRLGAHTETHLADSLAVVPRDEQVWVSLDTDGRLGTEYGASAFAAVIRAELGHDTLADVVARLRDVTIECMRCIDLAIAVYATEFPLLASSDR